MTSHPAAPLQTAMLATTRAQAGAYVQQVEIVFPDGTDPSRLASGFVRLTARFPALNQEFTPDLHGGSRVQLNENARVEVREESGAAPDAAAWMQLLAVDRAEGVDGHRLRIWPQARRVLWTFHHAVLDGRSTARVVRAWIDEAAGTAPDPGAPWSPWRPLADPDAVRTARKWAEQFPPEPEDPPPGRVAYQSAVRPVAIDAAAVAGRLGVTVHTLAQATAALVVGRMVDRDAVVLGQVRACGPSGTVGFGINTVPLVLGWDPGEPLRALLARAREASRSLREVAPMAPAQWLNLVRPRSRQAWDAVLVSERGTLDELVARPAARVTLHERSDDPVVLAAYLGSDARVQVESTVLAAPLNDWIADTWRELLETLGDLAETACHRLLPPEHETATGDPEPRTALYPEFAAVAQAHPDRPAIASRGSVVTYSQLAEAAGHVAATLATAGVAPGDRVAVRLTERPLLPSVLLATQQAGAVFVPLDPEHPAARHDRIWQDARPRLLVSETPPWREEIPRLDPKDLPAVASAAGGGCLPQFVDPEAPAALLYTSGTTGVPKGVRLTGAAIGAEARAIGRLIGIGTEDRVLQFASPGFDAFLEEAFLALLHGATLVPRPPDALVDFEAFTASLERERVTIADLPTAFWRGWTAWLAQKPGRFPVGLRAVIIGGEAATEAALEHWRAATPGGCQLWNTYGPTEATIVATAHPLHSIPGDVRGDPPIGRPLPGVVVRVAGRHGSPRPPGMPGEMWISGPGVSPGYWGRPELDAVAFVEHDDRRWYRTGDRARWNESGDLVFLGRTDDQIKLRGHRIEPEEVRRQVERVPGIQAAHVGLAGNPPMLVAWVVAQPAGAEVSERVRQSLATVLPAPLVPGAVLRVAALPLTARGKVDRTRLPLPSAGSVALASDDPMVAWACRLFAGILRRPVTEIDPAQDFQRQGGDSLLAMELSLRLREAGLALEPGELAHDSAPVAIARRFAHPTHTTPSRWEPVVVLRPGSEGFPPLVLIHATPGDVLGYGNLAAELPDNVPCWGVVSRVLHEPNHPHRSIPEMATDYLRALQARLGGKPFFLGGWCYGGLVAYEMACALERAGHPAPLRLLLLETWSPPPAAFALRLHWRALQLRTLLGQPRGWLGAYLRHKWRWGRPSGAEPAASTPRRDAAVAHNLAAAACYRAGSYRLPVDLFLTPDQGTDVLPLPEGGWSVLAPSRTMHACAGGHADLLHPPHVAGLAARITGLLAQIGVKP